MPAPRPLLIDSHCHSDDPRFEEDLEGVLHRARAAGVVAQIVPAVCRTSWPRVATLCQQHDDLFPCYGLHPYFLDSHRDEDLIALDQWLQDNPVVALGECGLDYFRKDLDRTRQRTVLQGQLGLASQYQLPVVLHVNKAVEDVLLMLADSDVRRGLLHSFNGSEQQAERAIALGFKLGFGGAATFSRARKLQAMVRELPLTALMIETDAPDQPPATHAGLTNEPAFLRDIFDAFCELRSESPEQLAAAFNRNACELFGLSSGRLIDEKPTSRDH